MKIAIISNCQGASLAACMREMSGTLEPQFFLLTTLSDGSVNVPWLFQEYDVVIAQRFIEQHMADMPRDRLVLFPDLAFVGHHPDMTYLQGKRIGSDVPEAIQGPMMHYNSSLVVHGYLRGLSADEIEARFTRETYRKLGYLNTWSHAEKALREEIAATGLNLQGAVDKWLRSGCFMHTYNHPTLSTVADVARAVLERLGVPVINQNPGRYAHDPLALLPIWPIYPEVAEATSYPESGDYAFKQVEPNGVIGLRAFIDGSLATYQQFDRDSIMPVNFYLAEFDRRLAEPAADAFANPYRNLPDHQFWKKGVATPAAIDVDPVVSGKFSVAQEQKVATAGSCFAQHIARTLSANGFNYFIPEQAPEGSTKEQAANRNFGVFSARYGNIYTARQLVQLLKRVSGEFVPQDQMWQRKDGRFVDPFRPQIEPEGFGSEAELVASRAEHFAAVRTMLEQMDVFVFTLGLTESWRAKSDGAIFPLAPGVAGGSMDADKYEFVNFSAADVIADMNEFIGMLSAINPACRVILTVSPVPLIATYEPKHALTATTYSKSVLRVAAEELSTAHAHVGYFPSFEVITGNYNRGAYFDDDLRTVTDAGVAHVMRLFMKHYAGGGTDQAVAAPVERPAAPAADEPAPLHRNVTGVVCDEEAIANFQV
ncbi:MAG: GSCFA domain-containing protein [Burkholderia sp.]|uniref:GSCFA domain-containing protein n=2 Tax=Burkholderiaceae TaxID=119060 RepID=UPI001589AD61|nr:MULTISPECIES: GSCFA domain-containing protein [Burkholderia]MCA3644470.1 GSCFA domain-containing protein [Methylobacterium sp.]MCA3777347.1 GSCFA domain-containing protein [Burkholderia sp.]MCA3784977.1 GSCFA domain-containing protein [Burkholderia sp.]MCA3798198.1 GSCFA domain-containing protein [Burkholderia sp.]MCA3806853.1 GSCFA domain-containing protein [Burkholderia sp.]